MAVIGENMSNLPVTTPAETLSISPEGLEVANQYLQTPSIAAVSDSLAIPPEYAAQVLDRKEVRAYINSVFFSTGFNNRFQIRELMDTIIKKKLQDMDETEQGSSKDITEILALSHRMTMELMDKEIQLEKLRAGNSAIKTQTNIQINSDGSKYGSLIEQLMRGNTLDAHN